VADAGVHGSIGERQLEAGSISVQRAAAVVHRRVQAIEAARISVGILLAVLGVIAVSIRGLTSVAALLGFVFALLVGGVGLALTRKQIRKVALLQELFDVSVFKLEWNEGLAGDPPTEADVHRLAKGLQPGSKRDGYIHRGWYDNIAGIPYPLDVLVCQEQNAGWDLRLRSRYRALSAILIGTWSLLGVAVGVVAGMPVDRLLLTWYLPFLPGMTIGLEIFIVSRTRSRQA
jgi:hypothetical protein